MKLLLQILVAIFLHPIALILVFINLMSRADIGTGKKILWGLVSLVWGIGPILYILLGEGSLW